MTEIEEILEHHGIIGQKWGVKRRIAKAQAKASTDREKSWKDSYEKRSSMTTAQLRSKVNRLQLENQYKQEVEKARPKSQSIISKYLTKPLANEAAASVRSTILKYATSALVASVGAYATTKITHSDIGGLILEHHGVKGQKWGVKRNIKNFSTGLTDSFKPGNLRKGTEKFHANTLKSTYATKSEAAGRKVGSAIKRTALAAALGITLTKLNNPGVTMSDLISQYGHTIRSGINTAGKVANLGKSILNEAGFRVSNPGFKHISKYAAAKMASTAL